jgi:glyoxylase-like metal-dependent hydrolase (beta-lactamase superfamily II)
MPVSIDIISVGTLSHNRFWNERSPVRLAHATTTLLRDEGRTLIVDPSLPPEILAERLNERCGLSPEVVDTVFLTNFRPIHRRGILLFDNADWLMSPAEIEAMSVFLNDMADASEARHETPDERVEQEMMLLGRIKPAPDRLTQAIHLFPTPGVTPGACSLLVLQETRTIAVAGDAIINKDYYEHSQTFEQHSDLAAAKRSFLELLEIADFIIPGHGDMILND